MKITFDCLIYLLPSMWKCQFFGTCYSEKEHKLKPQCMNRVCICLVKHGNIEKAIPVESRYPHSFLFRQRYSINRNFMVELWLVHRKETNNENVWYDRKDVIEKIQYKPWCLKLEVTTFKSLFLLSLERLFKTVYVK